MTTLRDCLQEIIRKGPGFFIRSYAIPGAYRISEWDSITLLSELEHEAPGLLDDEVWIEWRTYPGMGLTGSIQYGTRGLSLSHREVPAYGHLHVLELSQKYKPLTTTISTIGPLSELADTRNHRDQRRA